MKKNFWIILTGLLFFQVACADNDVVTKDLRKLPVKAKEFIEACFSNETVSYIKIDKEILTSSYEVVFTSGVEIDFNNDGDWKEIDCRPLPVPEDIIPGVMLDYVGQNFPEASVVKIKRKKRYELKLSNELELEFDKNGKFLKMDD
jgi:hypothetical protein